jgi:hypothetical protein
MQSPDVSVPVIKELKSQLEVLALLTLGQHLWVTKQQAPGSTCCLCNLCYEARKAHQAATGRWPTTKEEQQAMAAWGVE